MHFSLDAQFNADVAMYALFYFDAEKIVLSFQYYNDSSVDIDIDSIIEACQSITERAPDWMNQKYGKVSLQPLINQIPFICLLDLTSLTIYPRNGYALLSYTPRFDLGYNTCET